MSFFSTNRSQASTGNFEPLEEGYYEVFISSVEKKTFSTGSEGLSLVYTVRGDIEQPGGNRKLFDNLVCSEKAMFRWNDIAAATNMPDGITFNSADEVIQAFGKHLNGQALQVYVKQETYKEKLKNVVSGFSESAIGGSGQAPNAFDPNQYKDPFSDDGKPMDISDDDLPF